MIEEQQTLPDLIIADGGLGQMDAIKSIVADKLHLTIPIAGLVKDKNHHTNEMIFGLPPKKLDLEQQMKFSISSLIFKMKYTVLLFPFTDKKEVNSKLLLN